MDPEQTFLRVHARLSCMLAQLLSPRLRGFLEHLCLVVAILLLALLAVMHVNFASKMVGQGLWSQKSFHQALADIYDSGGRVPLDDSIQVFSSAKAWLYWLLSSSWNGKGRDNSHDGKSIDNVETEKSLPSAVERQAALLQLWDSWTLYGATWLARLGEFARRFARFWRNAGRDWLFPNGKDGTHGFSQKDLDSVEWSEEGSDGFEPVYLYSIERGYLLLPEDAKSHHNVQTINMSLSARNSCFGNRWQQLLINSLVGYDTILMNSLLEARGEGFLYNFQTKEIYTLKHPREEKGASSSLQGYIISKCGVLIMSLFVFFTTTMSVSFTLRETQARMLRFTVQLQYHARHRLPAFRLIFIHVIESLVFVPIMIGILFFLFEFYEDQLLAFMVLTLVWLCELFTMISVRTPVSTQFFPRYFFLYFMVFHIYFFSYEYGFSYLAFSATAAFMQHLVLYFWNHFEVPALQMFLRTTNTAQQSWFQITSSTIFSSTLHVARLGPNGMGGAAEENDRNYGYEGQFNRRAEDQASNGQNSRARAQATGNISERQTNNNGNAFSHGQEISNVNALPNLWQPAGPDRFWIEHWNGIARNHGRINGSLQDLHGPHNYRVSARDDRTLANNSNVTPSNLGGSTTAVGPHSRNTALSILLWILGGSSEHLSSYFTGHRNVTGGDNPTNIAGSPTVSDTPENQRVIPQSPRELDGEFNGLRHRARSQYEHT
ncbi:hypothetical protein KP509_04G107300 [Ceratopteris richardii]|uniref:Membralin n=1 Tax=Ceratopteris richardii TaxID=49495 RepID=A0A8T2V3D6_CERRI|nr:hypothetical protein KP509_04G107300 [Ceratopteris richardii]